MILDMLRKGQTWVTKGILIVLAITFAFGFGFNFSKFGFGGRVPEGTAAEVNGEEISILDFYRTRERVRSQYRESGVPEEVLNQNFIDMTALNELIDLKLLSQKAEELGFRVTDEELSEAIVSNPAFQVDGRFIGTNQYRSMVQQRLNESVGDFEKRYREELLAQKLVKLMFETPRVTDDELLNIYRIRNEKINLNFISFSPEDFRGSFKPTEEEIQKYYEINKTQFNTQEQRSFNYVTIKPEDFEARVNVTKEEIEAYYKANPDKFRSKENEIQPLYQVETEVEASIKEQHGKALIKEFLDNLQELIEKKSLEEITNESALGNIKSLGPISVSAKLSEIPSKAIEKAFSINKGEKAYARVGEAIYIVEVSQVIPSKEKTLKEAEVEIGEKLQYMKAKETAEAMAMKVLEQAKTNGEDLQKLAKSFGLKLQETGYFSRFERIPEINSDEVKTDAFFIDKQTRLASKVYKVEDRIYVISLKDERDADPKKFEEEKGQLREEELAKRKKELYTGWIQSLRKEAKINVNNKILLPKG
jgi:peptidyl-prolyl cis-trans isomerase D